METTTPRYAPNRLREWRENRGLTQQALADRVGTSNQMIGMLERRARKLTLEWMERLAPALGILPGELLPEGPDPLIQQVALVSWVQAGDFTDTVDPYVPVDTPRVPALNLPHDHFIALDVLGDSMDRVSPDGSRIFVDLTDREPRDGRFYVFRSTDMATYKRYRSRDGKVWLEPFSTNPDHEIILPNHEVEVVGRVYRSVLDL